MDGKAKIPVGQPGTPEATKSHMQKACTAKGVTLESSDHNYRAVNLTPSVNLLCEIPEDVTGSFYTGQIYVDIKDAVFEASDPLTHVVELLFVFCTEKGINSLSPYWVLFSDGGGDHNLTFLYV